SNPATPTNESLLAMQERLFAFTQPQARDLKGKVKTKATGSAQEKRKA
ncbi:MAG: hypothetical protein JWM28_2054, partial [Chitinophagaceae bacterium]|nr:hypothetical protein [Chitinophagaceae bacterium]